MNLPLSFEGFVTYESIGRYLCEGAESIVDEEVTAEILASMTDSHDR